MAPIPLVPTASASTTRHTPTTISESPLASLHSSNHGDHRAVHTPSRQIPELLRAPLPHPAPTRQFDHAPEANELRSNSLGDQTKSVHPSATPETHTGQVQGIAVGLRGGNRHSVIHSNVNSNAGQMTLRATLGVGNLDYKANNSSATQLRATPPNRDDIGHAGIPHGSRESLAPSKRSPAAFINGFELRQPGASITDIGPHQLQFVQAHSPSGNVTQPSPVMAAYTPSDKGDKQGVVTRDLPHLGHPQAPHNNTPEKPASSHNHLHRRSSSAALAMQPLLPKLPSHSAADPTSSFMTNQHSQPHVVLLERPPSVQPGRAHKKSLESMIDPVGLSALANPPPNSNKYMHVHGPAQSQPEWIPPGSASTQAPTIPTLSTALGTSSTPKADRRTSIQKPSSAGTKHPTSENGVAESAIPQSTPKPVRLNIQHKGLADILFSPTVTKTSPSVSHVQHQDRPFEKLNGSGESLLVAKDASPLLVAPLRSHQRTDSGHADNDLGRQERATNPRFVNNHDVPDPRNMPTKQSATHPISSIQAVESKVKLSPASGHSINIGRPNDDHSSTPPAPAHVSTRRSNDVVVSTQAQLPPSSSQNAPQFWQPPPEPFTDNTHRAQTSSHGRLHSSSNVPTVDVPRKRDRRKSITPNLENTKQPILGGTGTSTPSLAFQGHQTTHPVHIPTSIPQTVQPSPRVEDTRAPPPTPILIPPTSGQFTPITRVMSVDTGLQSPATSAGLSLQVNTSRVSLPTELPDPKGKSRLFGNILPSFSSRSKHSKDVKDQSATQAEPRTPFKQEKEKEKDSLSNSKLKKKDRDKDRDKERARNTAGERDKEEKRTLPAKAADDSAKADHVVYTPFTYKLPKKKWTMSAASLEARDGISTNATTIIGSPTTSVLSQNPAFQLPPLRDPLKAAKEWQKKEAAELRLLPGGKVKRHPPGVTFIDVEDDSPHRAHTSKPTRSKKRAR
ncbi:hypothetical protein AX16_003752 [Volvariella volvacea WC 439]|nr:hypothetical protein AX16_003752 [Volvariella volvacea WC 439]